MKKHLPKILIPILITAIFLAPVSAGREIKKAEAQNTDENLIVNYNNTSVIVDIYINPSRLKDDTNYVLSVFLFDGKEIPDPNTLPSSGLEPIQKKFVEGVTKKKATEYAEISKAKTITFRGLTPKHNYYLLVNIIENTLWKSMVDLSSKIPNAFIIPVNIAKALMGIFNADFTEQDIPYRVTKTFSTSDTSTYSDSTVSKTIDQTPASFDCGITNLGGCVLQIFYGIWQASAWVATLAGHFLDFFVYYSTDSGSYGNEFVSKAWGAVRDIANIFFIIALLYVAIKTILGLNVTDNKKLVGTVIIIALIINFSLFTTKVVIDGSNILAKIFYNNITSESATETNADGTPKNVTEKEGEKSISIGLVEKFNPQDIVMDAYNANLGFGYAFFIELLLIGITLYTAFIFFSVALLFVARVVSLWIAMIFSPIAFVSYAVPFEIPGFGHKEWWSDLLKNAFLAPVFIFFLYIIILFAEFLTEIVNYTSDSSLNDATNIIRRLLTIVVPFVILMALLKKSKELAVKYSGEMGAAVMNAGKMVGGLALGAATGGAALLGSKTIGAKALSVANDDNLRAQASGDKEHFAKMGITDVNVQKQMQKKAQKKLASANKWAGRSFDLGQTGIGKSFSKMSGMNLSGGRISGTKTENLKGGRKAYQERINEKAQEKMKSYEMTPEEEANRNVRAEEYLKNKNKTKEELDKDLPEREKAYNEEYEKELANKKIGALKNGAFLTKEQENSFKENYERDNPPPKSSFDEKAFKTKYMEDNKLKEDDITPVNRTQINKDRRTAYANSLQTQADKDEGRGAVKTFFEEFKKEAIKIAKNPVVAGLGVSGIVTGGAGTILAGATILGGGFLHGLKESIITAESGVLKSWSPKNIRKSETAKMIGAIRKGENPNKDIIRELKKMTEQGHGDSGKLDTIAKKITNIGNDKKEEH